MHDISGISTTNMKCKMKQLL